MKLSQARENDVIIIEGEKYVLDSSIRSGNRRICVKRLSDNQIACFSATQECILECQNDQRTYLERLADNSTIEPVQIIDPEPTTLEDYLAQINSQKQDSVGIDHDFYDAIETQIKLSEPLPEAVKTAINKDKDLND